MKKKISVILVLAIQGIYADYVTPIISAQCASNNNVDYIAYSHPDEATASIFYDLNRKNLYSSISSLKPYWDIRSVNHVSKYINGGSYAYPNQGQFTGLDVNRGYKNIGIGTEISEYAAGGSIAQSECVNGYLAGGALINRFDAPSQSITYGGQAMTFSYTFERNPINVWNSNKTGNLMIQGQFEKPWYYNYDGKNAGGEVNIIAYMHNSKTGKLFSYVISVYRTTQKIEEKPVQFDTSTNIPHASTMIANGTRYVTKSTFSKSTQRSRGATLVSDDNTWNDFYRVNISYTNMKNALKSAANTKDKKGIEADNAQLFASNPANLNPANWDVTSIGLQYEIYNSGVGSSLAGSFRAFEAYSTSQPI